MKTKMTPEEKTLRKQARDAEKLLKKQEEQDAREKEEAEFKAGWELAFYKMFAEVALLSKELKDRRDRDYKFNEQHHNIAANFYKTSDGDSVLSVSNQNYYYGCKYLLQLSEPDEYSFRQCSAEVQSIKEVLTEYDAQVEAERIEAERKENLRTSALSKLSAEEKAALGVR